MRCDTRNLLNVPRSRSSALVGSHALDLAVASRCAQPNTYGHEAIAKPEGKRTGRARVWLHDPTRDSAVAPSSSQDSCGYQ